MARLTQRLGIIVPVALIALLPSAGGAFALLTLAAIGFAAGFVLRGVWAVVGLPLLILSGVIGWTASQGDVTALWQGLSPLGIVLTALLYLLWFAAPAVLGAAAGAALRRVLDHPAIDDLAH